MFRFGAKLRDFSLIYADFHASFRIDFATDRALASSLDCNFKEKLTEVLLARTMLTLY